MGLISKIKSKIITKVKETAIDTVKTKTENTVIALQLIAKQFKGYAIIFKYGFVCLSAILSIVNIITGAGIIYVHCLMLLLLVIYVVLDFIFKQRRQLNPNKKLKFFYVWIKLGLNAISLGATIYSLIAVTDSATIKPISIILTTFSIIAFVLKLLLEIVVEVVQSKWKILRSALILDGFIKDDPNESLIKEQHLQMFEDFKEEKRQQLEKLEQSLNKDNTIDETSIESECNDEIKQLEENKQEGK